MTDEYRIFGSELSPYSVKIRSYFRYKQIPHQWIPRSAANAEEFQKYAKLPLVPLVVSPEGQGIQDSTPIIDAMETQFSAPSVHPEEPVSRFVSILLEEFGDEWGNKWMFHQRWARQADQLSAAGRIAGFQEDDAAKQQFVEQVLERMVNRVWFVGSNEITAPIIEQSFRDSVSLLDTHLASRPYVLGGKPSYADFGLWGQLYNAWTDPTGASLINGSATHLLGWIHRMLWPVSLGEFESFEALSPTLSPLLAQQVGALFLPWSVANANALAAGAEDFSVDLNGQEWTQKPQKYHARSLAALKTRYSGVANDPAIKAVLEKTGCLASLSG